MIQDTSLHVTIDSELKAAIMREAGRLTQEEGRLVSISEVVRRILRQALQNEQHEIAALD